MTLHAAEQMHLGGDRPRVHGVAVKRHSIDVVELH